MGKRVRTGIREKIADLLQVGVEITPDMVVELLGSGVPETEARELWARTLTARLVHTTARELGLLALSLGPSRGFKIAETSEEFAIARARTLAQLRGQGKRRSRLKEKLALVNQHVFPLDAAPVEEVRVNAGTGTLALAKAASQ